MYLVAHQMIKGSVSMFWKITHIKKNKLAITFRRLSFCLTLKKSVTQIINENVLISVVDALSFTFMKKGGQVKNLMMIIVLGLACLHKPTLAETLIDLSYTLTYDPANVDNNPEGYAFISANYDTVVDECSNYAYTQNKGKRFYLSRADLAESFNYLRLSQAKSGLLTDNVTGNQLNLKVRPLQWRRTAVAGISYPGGLEGTQCASSGDGTNAFITRTIEQTDDIEEAGGLVSVGEDPSYYLTVAFEVEDYLNVSPGFYSGSIVISDTYVLGRGGVYVPKFNVNLAIGHVFRVNFPHTMLDLKPVASMTDILYETLPFNVQTNEDYNITMECGSGMFTITDGCRFNDDVDNDMILKVAVKFLTSGNRYELPPDMPIHIPVNIVGGLFAGDTMNEIEFELSGVDNAPAGHYYTGNVNLTFEADF